MKMDRSALSRAAQPPQPGPYDRYFEGAALPKGAGINQKTGKVYLDDKGGTVLLNTQARDKMVHNEKQRYTDGDRSHEGTRLANHLGWSNAYDKLSKNGLSKADDRKLANMERHVDMADLKVNIDETRRELGKYMKQAASDFKLTRVEQDKIGTIEENLSKMQRTLERLDRQDSLLDKVDRQEDRLDRSDRRAGKTEQRAKAKQRPSPRGSSDAEGPASTDLKDLSGYKR